MEPQQMPPELDDVLDDLWYDCVGLIAAGVPYADYLAHLRRMHAGLPQTLREQGLWPILQAGGQMAWCNTPHPGLNYALASVPKPQRNAACPCGSGRKYKHCCLPAEQSLPPFPAVNLLPMLLEQLPRRRWAELTDSKVPADMVADAARQLIEAGDVEDACTLLEPWFAGDNTFRARREELFDDLLDAYGEASHSRKKKRLIERAIRVGDVRIQSAAWQRKATMLADAGEHAQAWQCFTRAQRVDPQSPSLSHLEVTLLFNEGRYAEARERARFWVHRLEARRDPDLDRLIGLLRQVAEQGEQGMGSLLMEHDPPLQELAEQMRSAPAVEALYRLEPGADSAGPLQPKRKLKAALDAWQGPPSDRFGAAEWDEDMAADGVAACLPALESHPELWNAFEMLLDLVEGIRARGVGFLDDVLARPLLDRAEALLHEVLRANHAEGKAFEWGWMENRAALDLLGQRIHLDGDAFDDPDQVARLEWLVLTLNRNDNQGFRDMLVRAYLSTGRVDAALDLCGHYPDDFASMRYNHALALYAADQKGEACRILRDAVERGPKLLTWLLRKNPKPPKMDPWGFTVGGDDEAWLYREETLALWEKLGAMEWLRQCAKAFKAGR